MGPDVASTPDTIEHLPAVDLPVVDESMRVPVRRHDLRLLADAVADVGPRLTGREARWVGDGKADIVGPAFAATWGGSPEEKAEAERVKEYTEAMRRRVRGE